jgi:hypothetical protein
MPWSDQAVLARTHDQLAPRSAGERWTGPASPTAVAPGPEAHRPARAPGASGAGRPLRAGQPGPDRCRGGPGRRGDRSTMPWSWPRSTGRRASSGPRSTWWASRRDSCPSSTPQSSGIPRRGAQVALRGAHPGVPRAPLLVGPGPAHGQRPADGASALAVAGVGGEGLEDRQWSDRLEGCRPTDRRDAGHPRQVTRCPQGCGYGAVVSMNTGV